MSSEVIQTLRGKVITKNDRKVEYGDTIEEWSPFNADLHMQGIKVMVKEPVPVKIQKGDAFEDTMLLLEMMKEKKQRERKQQREDLIRAMAMEKKQREKKQQREDLIRAMAMEKKRKLGMGNQSNNQYLKLTF